jgi:hypothetical protein
VDAFENQLAGIVGDNPEFGGSADLKVLSFVLVPFGTTGAI